MTVRYLWGLQPCSAPPECFSRFLPSPSWESSSRAAPDISKPTGWS